MKEAEMSFSYKEHLLHYQGSGEMSRDLFNNLVQLIKWVLSQKGIRDSYVYEEVQGAFFEKLLKFKTMFYTRLRAYQENQVRAFLKMTIKSVLADFFRREKLDRLRSLDAFEAPETLLPETTWHHYKLEAYTLYQKLWGLLGQDLKELFCLIYNGGLKLEAVAKRRGQSLGKVHKDKARIGQVVAPEASVEEVAQMVYRLMATELCCDGLPVQSSMA